MKRLILISLLFLFAGSAAGYKFLGDDGKLALKGEVSKFRSLVPPINLFCNYSDRLEYYYYTGDNPLWEKNNKFGIYIYAEDKDFFELAQNLVNSNGGRWGYVLIPYNVKDYDRDKWVRVFEQLNNKQLIPIIQLWDVDLDDYKSQTRDAAEFLNSFKWPVRYRYISVYNEPNDSKFWYGKVDPKGYADVLDYTINTFKSVNPEFMIMNGAFNTSSPTDGIHMDAFEYMKEMESAVPGIFEKLDGWASHSYPQPNFAGSPYVTGRWSIKAYEVELDFLMKSLGVEKKLPVFITETGWAHAEGKNYDSQYLPLDTVAEYYKVAYEDVWLKDDRVRAVTPFTIIYEPPFDHFSWISADKVPYKQYEEIRKIKKVKGDPPVLESAVLNLRNCADE